MDHIVAIHIHPSLRTHQLEFDHNIKHAADVLYCSIAERAAAGTEQLDIQERQKQVKKKNETGIKHPLLYYPSVSDRAMTSSKTPQN